MEIVVKCNSNASSDVEGSTQTLAHVIFDLARTHGDLVAISRGGQRFTYSNLAARASQLAERFRPYSGSRGPIAVATNDTAELVTAALAGWLLGCPYLPLDPACPSHRVTVIMRESGAVLLATGASGSREYPAGPWAIVPLTCSQPENNYEPSISPAPQAEPADPAYIIYTSGSTGLPKGVTISHANLAHFVRWYRHAFSPDSSSRSTQFASLTFDASIFEIWPCLAAGSSVWPLDRSIGLAEKEIQTFILDNAITHCFAPTAIAEELLSLEWPEQTRLRFLLTGADTLRRFPRPGLPFQLINNYGPTECTVLATSGVVEPRENTSELPSIGRPIPGAQVYILDEELQPVQCGGIGEIFIGGRGVGSGYVGQPKLTQDCFLDNPFGSGTRIYRTGDRGRFRENDELEFLGRLDSQLKIRGYRIEPDEIVHRLRSHTSVNACAVKAIGMGSNAQFAVYVQLNNPVTADELREYLAEHLPSYMIPDFFVHVERLPLSDRGKVEMARLPLPEETNLLPNRTSEEQTASDEIETELAAIVSRLLKRPSISTTDNFFRLGGHSLLAAQVIVHVRQSFGVDLPLRSVFEEPTVRALAALIEQRIIASLSARAIEIPGQSPIGEGN